MMHRKTISFQLMPQKERTNPESTGDKETKATSRITNKTLTITSAQSAKKQRSARPMGPDTLTGRQPLKAKQQLFPVGKFDASGPGSEYNDKVKPKFQTPV